MIRLSLALAPGYAPTLLARSSGQQSALIADVTARLARAGAGDVRLVIQDPTDPARASALVSRVPTAADPAFRVVSFERVADVRLASASSPEASSWLPRLDRGLTPAEAIAVGRALERETNPRHLAGFAGTFEPHFPVAASLLRSRAFEVEPGGYARHAANHRDVVVGQDAILRMRVGAIASLGEIGLPVDVGLGEVRRLACRFVATGETLAPVQGTPIAISGLAAACIRPSRAGWRLVDKGAIEAASPSPADAGYVSPAALQLAMAAAKPGSARVWNASAVPATFAGLDARVSGPERVDQLRAKLAVEKADKTLQRQRWVRWYERTDA
jgi:hypothetical protein